MPSCGRDTCSSGCFAISRELARQPAGGRHDGRHAGESLGIQLERVRHRGESRREQVGPLDERFDIGVDAARARCCHRRGRRSARVRPAGIRGRKPASSRICASRLRITSSVSRSEATRRRHLGHVARRSSSSRSLRSGARPRNQSAGRRDRGAETDERHEGEHGADVRAGAHRALADGEAARRITPVGNDHHGPAAIRHPRSLGYGKPVC